MHSKPETAGEAFQASQPKLPLGEAALSRGPAIVNFVITGLAVFFAALHLYAALYGSPATLLFRPVHLTVALALIFFWYPLGRRWDEPFNRCTPVDLACAAASGFIFYYYVQLGDDIALRSVVMTTLDYVVALALIALVLEAVRRTVGNVIVVIVAIAIVYALSAESFPGILHGPSVAPQRLVSTFAYGNNGLFGVPLGVMANYVFLYILFGAMLSTCGAGNFFNNLAFSAFGHHAGGPAKAAVASSAIQGTISGSAISNVLVSGSFTIPMMKKLGYRPPFAGAVEAVSSNGGIITPPIMGAVAFMMAEFTNTPYSQIAMAAAIPAFLYFYVVFLTVHFEAYRLGLPVFDRSSLPSLRAVLMRDGFLLLPLVIVTGALITGYSVAKVAVVGIAACFLLSFVRERTRLTPMRLLFAVKQAVRDTIGLSVTCAAVGLIIAVFYATGLNFQIIQAAAKIAESSTLLLLFVTAVLAMILGMGLSATAVYITMVATVIPILVQAEVTLIAAHLFAVYFGIAANITPPVALAAFAAAPLAGANPMHVAMQSVRLGVGLYLLPFMFVYEPALLLMGSTQDIVITTSTALVGMTALAAATSAYLFAPMGPLPRMILFLGAIGMIHPSPFSDLTGLAVILAIAVPNYRRRSRTQRLPVKQLSPDEAQDMSAEVAAPKGLETGHSRLVLTLGWAILVLGSAIVIALGSRTLHAASPMIWLAALGGVGLLTTGLLILNRRSAVRS
ncbi:MAG: TRAP transporter fused permease subunit [Mesorhizobium sp.]|nr:TRAP transporter fused permease subunit [Mesorhizobium sp.]